MPNKANASQSSDNFLFPTTARAADLVLDHLSWMVRETGRAAGRVERIHGMDLQYWTDRIDKVINETRFFSTQHMRAKRLLAELRSSDRA